MQNWRSWEILSGANLLCILLLTVKLNKLVAIAHVL
jgi:hypothetical protein